MLERIQALDLPTNFLVGRAGWAGCRLGCRLALLLSLAPGSTVQLLAVEGAAALPAPMHPCCAPTPACPSLPQDELVDKLGGGTAVAEMTGRKARILRDAKG